MSRHVTAIEFPVVVEYDYHKGHPGRTYGPPEKCYPEEPAYVEITSVKVLGVEVTLEDADMERIQEEIETKITEQATADEQDYWDNVRKERRHECSEVIQEDCE
jgi:hypothetical protein